MNRCKIFINGVDNEIKIFKSKNNLKVNIFNKNRILKLALPKNFLIKFEISTKTVEIFKKFSENWYKIIESNLNTLLFSFNQLWHIKVKFMGKGFKIKKKRKTRSIKFYFYYSHINVIILKKAKMKQKKKNKFIIKTPNKNTLIKTHLMITKIRPLNIYTKRGIRISKQLVFKKTGKKSNY